MGHSQQQVGQDLETGGRTPAIEAIQQQGRSLDGGHGNAARADALGLGPGGPADDHGHSHGGDEGGGSGPATALATDEVQVRRGGGTWTVRRGDTLWEIARRTYGVGTYWTRIRDANPGGVSGRDVIRVGTVLTLPELDVPASSSPSAVAGVWTVEGVIAILNQGTGRSALQKIVRDRIRIVRFDTAFDIWEYDDGRREQQELTGLRGNTLQEERTIRVRTSLPTEEAAIVLFHELNHWGRPETTTQEGYLDEEIDVRVQTEEFAISANLPETGRGYRNADGSVNRQLIRDQIYNSPHYNPTGRRRVGREYAGDTPTSGWRVP